MRSRLLVGSLVLAMVLAVSVRPATAASGSISIGEGGADGEVAGGFWRSPFMNPPIEWTPFDHCATGLEIVNAFRWAIEFPLVSLPADATITEASLALRTASPDRAGQTAIRGYAGDGSITVADVLVTGLPVLFTPTTSAVRESWDVTALLAPAMRTAGWAGFSVTQEPWRETAADWDCPGDARDAGRLYPILTIQYTVPDPSPTPSPSPTPTPSPTPVPSATPPPSPTPTPTPRPTPTPSPTLTPAPSPTPSATPSPTPSPTPTPGPTPSPTLTPSPTPTPSATQAAIVLPDTASAASSGGDTTGMVLAFGLIGALAGLGCGIALARRPRNNRQP